MTQVRLVFVFSLIFVVSGFSGLIYESIWSHYLKLFLGHAAYAQTLVLAIFMGGMALGAWIAARVSKRWRNLLIVYALVEAIIGLVALVFHETFQAFLQLAYSSILPSLGSVVAVQLFKWTSASLLILPQTILLGMTFPLMTAGVIRHAPEHQGRVIAVYYFANSIGASIGVLVGGFLLIDWFGLPGTIRTAGVLNIIVAITVAVLLKKLTMPVIPVASVDGEPDSPTVSGRTIIFYLFLSLATGLASFIYEVSWIRMLSLVLGSSTHAFEMMLSAFILGLAFGSYWLRTRIDRLKQEVRFLAYAQLLMGFFALMTLPLYNSTFDIMQWIVSNVDKTDQGYWWFNLSSHALALLVMLPTTFCAGLTLPLITHILLKTGYGEKSIGNVYAFNTIGAIVGVLITVHVLLPVIGVKNSLLVGALIDVGLGVLILGYLAGKDSTLQKLRFFSPAVAVCVAMLFVAVLVNFDSYKMASGVYRHGNFYTPENAELLFHQDGKTASVDLVRIKSSNEVSIITNGKPDASINIDDNGVPSPDEATMVLAGALPLAIKPDSRNAAVIGLGSGLTTHVLLSANRLESVDTIEIEPAIVEAAKGFQPRVANVYHSPNSHIYIDDAKSYFSTHNKKYDLVVSEPSNPWVSGVAGLFSEEFYGLVANYLNNDGIFVQWLQLYEIDLPLVASVLKAMSRKFDDYVIYAANNNDLIIMARNGKGFDAPSERIFAFPMLARELARVRVRSTQDLEIRKLGNKAFLDAFFQSYDISPNSDYYPVLDLNAIKARFLQRNAMQIVTLRDDPVKTLATLQGTNTFVMQTQVTPSRFFYPADLAYAAMLIRDFLVSNRINRQFGKLPPDMRQNVMNLSVMNSNCTRIVSENALLQSMNSVASMISPYLSRVELSRIWGQLETSPCIDHYSQRVLQQLQLNKAIANANAQNMGHFAEVLLNDNLEPTGQVLFAGMAGKIALNEKHQAAKLWEKYESQILLDERSELRARLLKAHAK